jgi:hypothetical protein
MQKALRQGNRGFLVIRVLLFLILAVLVAVPAVLVIAGIESHRLVEPPAQLSHQDVDRIRQILALHDPRHLEKRERRTLSLTERDLNLMIQYAAPRGLKISSQADLQPNDMLARLTLELPDNPLGGYLNLSAALSMADGRLHVDRLDIGRLEVPGWLLKPVVLQIHRLMMAHSDDYRMVVESISSLRFEQDRLVMVYHLDPELVERIQQRSRQHLVSEAEALRMLAYQEALARIAAGSVSFHRSLAEVLPPLFQLAATRTAAGSKPQDENRALLQTLALHALGMNIGRFLGSAHKPADSRLHMTLLKRHDLVKHYLLSAALTVSAGSGLAGAIGVYKELDDSSRGTGFSFPDLLADRAGIRLAELATGTTRQATRVQQFMGAPLSESDFMPDIKELPEGIMELEFKQRYRDLDSREYRLVEDEINRRLDTCTVYNPG